MQSDNYILEVKNLAFGYSKKAIHNQINFGISPGRLVCLVGRNGMGKTTLFKTISSLLEKIEGDIILEKLSIDDTPELSKKLSLVLTDKIVLGGIDIETLIAMGRHPYSGRFGKLSPEDKNMVAHSIGLLGLEKLRLKTLDQVSDGERQKAMIARAIAQDTPLVLMDEPTAFLDFPSKIEMLSSLRKLVDQTGKTILFSTHEIRLIPELIDDLLLLVTDGLKHYKKEESSLKKVLDDAFEIKPLNS